MEKKKAAPPANELAVKGKPEKKKKKGRGKLILILILVLLLVGLIAGAVLSYIYDFFGLRTAIVGFFIQQDDQYAVWLNRLEQKEAELAAKETSLNDIALQQQEIALQLQEEQARLDREWESINASTQELDDRITAFDNTIIGFDTLVDTIAAMDSQSAAEMLEGIWPVEDAARILAKMDAGTAASILEEMSTENARSMAEVLLLMTQ